MIIKIVLDENAYMPTKAHLDDAGFDLYSPISVVIPKRGHVSIDTGVHIQIPSGMVGFLKSKMREAAIIFALGRVAKSTSSFFFPFIVISYIIN